MLSDIEIAQQAKMLPITEVAAKLGIGEEDIESMAVTKAKCLWSDPPHGDKPAGKLVLVTAITPYAMAGEGKFDYYRRTGPGPGQN